MKKHYLLLTSLFFIIFVSLIVSVDTSFINSSKAISKELTNEVNSLRANEILDYHIALEEDNDLDMVTDQTLVQKLKQKNSYKQAEIINYLKTNNIKYESHFIINMISISSTRKVLKEILNNYKVCTVYKQNTIKSNDFKQSANGSLTSKIDATSEVAWNIKRINAHKVWEEGITGEGVVVGILDTAVDVNHPSLQRKFKGYNPDTKKVEFKEENFFDAIEGKKQLTPEMDQTHGTHVMGTILGSVLDQNNKEINKIGVAPNAKFITARILDDKFSQITDIVFIRAGEWMLAPGGNSANAPKIINNSWGGGKVTRWFEGIVKRWKQAGILPVFAAGNQAYDEPTPGPGSISVPAAYADSFAVGATTLDDNLAYFSKKGPSPFLNAKDLIKPEVSAPGMTIRSAWPGGKYLYLQGTSMACPHVSGLAALLLSKDPTISVDKLKDIITTSATPKSNTNEYPNNEFGYGIINAKLAFDKLVTNRDIKFLKINLQGPSEAEISIAGSIKQKVSLLRPYVKYISGYHQAEISSYGYALKKQILNFSNDSETITLQPISSVNLTITTQTDNYTVVLVDNNQQLYNYYSPEKSLVIRDLLPGSYKIIISKIGYRSETNDILLSENENFINVSIDNLSNFKNKTHQIHNNSFTKTDEKKHFHIGNTNQETSFGYEGCAVLFPNNKNIKLNSVQVNLYKSHLTSFQGTKLKLSIKTIDKFKRYQTILNRVSYNCIGGMINILDLTRYNLVVSSDYIVIIEEQDKNERGIVIYVDDKNYLSNNSFAYINHNLYDFHFDRNLSTNIGGGDLGISINYEDDETTSKFPTSIVIDKIYKNEAITGSVAVVNHKLLFTFSNLSVLIDLKNNKTFSQLIYFDLLEHEKVTITEIDSSGNYSYPIYKKVLFDRSTILLLMSNLEVIIRDNKLTCPRATNIINETKLYLETIDQMAENDIDVISIQQTIDDKTNQITKSFIDEDVRRKKLITLLDKANLIISNTSLATNGENISIFNYYITDKYSYEAFLNYYQTLKQRINDLNLTTSQIEYYTNSFEADIFQFKALRQKGQASPIERTLINYFETHKELFEDKFTLIQNKYIDNCEVVIKNYKNSEISSNQAKSRFYDLNTEFRNNFISHHLKRQILLTSINSLITQISSLPEANNEKDIIINQEFIKGNGLKQKLLDYFTTTKDSLINKDMILEIENKFKEISEQFISNKQLFAESLKQGTKQTSNTLLWENELEKFKFTQDFFTNKYKRNTNLISSSLGELITNNLDYFQLPSELKKIKDTTPTELINKNILAITKELEFNNQIIYLEENDLDIIGAVFNQKEISITKLQNSHKNQILNKTAHKYLLFTNDNIYNLNIKKYIKTERRIVFITNKYYEKN